MDKDMGWFCAAVVLLGSALITWMVYTDKEVGMRDAARQVQIDTFYRDHNCRPLGYVATKYEPVRTYQCDNGVFIPRDMGR